jgi:polysaccharide biosynthesis protein PslH
MKILQICHKMPFPLRDGGAISIFHTALGLLCQDASVKILAVSTPQNPADPGCIPPDFVEKTGLQWATVDTRTRPWDAFINLFTGKSYFAERFFSEGFRSELVRILAGSEFDVIQLEHVYMCLYLETIRHHSGAKVVLRPQNVENQVWYRYLDKETNLVKRSYLRLATARLLEFERTSANGVDGILAISAGDAGIFKAYAPATPVISVPVGIDFTGMSSFNPDLQYEKFPVYYHLGSMDWLPNLQGLQWFVEEVIPVIKKEYPAFRFRIAGKKMPVGFSGRLPGTLENDGEVEDPVKYQEDKAVMIVPLLSGGGIRVKIIAAMVLGKTIISTSIGAEGIPYTNGSNILIADTPQEFARQVVKCKNSPDLCRSIGKKAQLLAREHYDCRRTALDMISFYKTLHP